MLKPGGIQINNWAVKVKNATTWKCRGKGGTTPFSLHLDRDWLPSGQVTLVVQVIGAHWPRGRLGPGTSLKAVS